MAVVAVGAKRVESTFLLSSPSSYRAEQPRMSSSDALPSRAEMDEFLRSVYPDKVFLGEENPGRPFVTLSYAQSLDGKIAGPGGQQILLSGDASMALTHRSVCILFPFYALAHSIPGLSCTTGSENYTNTSSSALAPSSPTIPSLPVNLLPRQTHSNPD